MCCLSSCTSQWWREGFVAQTSSVVILDLYSLHVFYIIYLYQILFIERFLLCEFVSLLCTCNILGEGSFLCGSSWGFLFFFLRNKGFVWEFPTHSEKGSKGRGCCALYRSWSPLMIFGQIEYNWPSKMVCDPTINTKKRGRRRTTTTTSTAWHCHLMTSNCCTWKE